MTARARRSDPAPSHIAAAEVALPGLPTKARLHPLYPRTPTSPAAQDARGRLTLTAAPLSVQVFRLR